MAVQILIAEGKHGKVKIIAQSSYDTIVQRISGIRRNGYLCKTKLFWL